MKRIIALTISLALAACLLAACGDDETYRQPGNGTTLGTNITTEPPAMDDNGSYSAGPDGDVSQTTDENILEDGMNDVEDGIEQGLDGIEEGIDDMRDDANDMRNDANDMRNDADDMGSDVTTGGNSDGSSH